MRLDKKNWSIRKC